ncbi:MAG: EboA domain-containing protein [Imperialibacter sp.]
MFSYDARALSGELSAIIESSVSKDAWQWLQEKSGDISSSETGSSLNVAFAAIPRKVSKNHLSLSEGAVTDIQQIRPGFQITNWSIDRLCRVWVLIHVPAASKTNYLARIQNLFLAAEMNELVALYSALPVLAYPEAWKAQCAEGIRSNIGDVLEAIMCNNPYPSEQLDEAAWNQLVLKAIFTEKPLHSIIGLDDRANLELANTLSDFAHERWAAHRAVPPMLWRCVGPFINEKTIGDMERLVLSVDSTEREAAVLACGASQFPAATELLDRNKQLNALVKSGDISWESIAKKTELV